MKYYPYDEYDEFDKKANPCPECGSTNLEPTKNRFGWQVECFDCGEVAEYDASETLAEHRSAE